MILSSLRVISGKIDKRKNIKIKMDGRTTTNREPNEVKNTKY